MAAITGGFKLLKKLFDKDDDKDVKKKEITGDDEAKAAQAAADERIARRVADRKKILGGRKSTVLDAEDSVVG